MYSDPVLTCLAPTCSYSATGIVAQCGNGGPAGSGSQECLALEQPGTDPTTRDQGWVWPWPAAAVLLDLNRGVLMCVLDCCLQWPSKLCARQKAGRHKRRHHLHLQRSATSPHTGKEMVAGNRTATSCGCSSVPSACTIADLCWSVQVSTFRRAS